MRPAKCCNDADQSNNAEQSGCCEHIKEKHIKNPLKSNAKLRT
jgi:hypothetical protein